MRKPINPNFERMRAEAERQRLVELEARSAALSELLASQSESAEQARKALESENAALKAALEAQQESDSAKTAALAARCEALTAELESKSKADAANLEQLRAALASEVAGARTNAAELEAKIGALSGRVTKVDESFSEPQRLRQVIAPVLSGAFRDVESDEHNQLTSAIAPYVVSTIRSEILNSEDELVEAIHPRLGTLIAAALANVVEELNRKVDDALPIDRWMASVKGRLTGAPPAGWLLDNGETFVVKEALLIDRYSGVLLASERSTLDDEAAPDEDLMAGMIAALQGFASEAYGATGAGDLRRFSFTEDTVYLRGTPTKLLAVRCSGVAPPEIERRVDNLLVTALGRIRTDDELPEQILAIDAFNTPTDPPGDAAEGVSASAIMSWGVGGIAALIALVWGHSAVTNAHEARWLASVEEAAKGDGSFSPYPLTVSRAEDSDVITVTGLLPDEAAKAALEERIRKTASPIPVTIDIALVGGVAQ